MARTGHRVWKLGVRRRRMAIEAEGERRRAAVRARITSMTDEDYAEISRYLDEVIGAPGRDE
jgi:hypothetical protein